MSNASAIPGAVNPQPVGIPQTGPAFVRFVSDRFEQLERRLAHVADRLVPRDRVWRKIATGNTDASGNLTLEVLTVPEGYELFLHRLYINDGSTFGSPTTGGAVSIQVDGQEEDGLSLVTVGLSRVFTASSSTAIVYDGGERIEVVMQGAGASKAITCIARGHLVKSRLDVNAS